MTELGASSNSLRERCQVDRIHFGLLPQRNVKECSLIQNSNSRNLVCDIYIYIYIYIYIIGISWNIWHLQDIDPWERADYLRRFCRYTSVLRGGKEGFIDFCSQHHLLASCASGRAM